MAAKLLPDQALLLKLLRYDPDTGKLFWRERTPDMFPQAKNPEVTCSQFNTKYAGREAFTSEDRGYRVSFMSGYGRLRAHRVIWCMAYGDWPEQIDHDDQRPANNRLENLQVTDHERNGRNAQLSGRNHSGRIGVNWRKREKKWRAKIRHDGRYIELGMFSSFEAACSARANAEKQFGYSPRHGSARPKP